MTILLIIMGLCKLAAGPLGYAAGHLWDKHKGARHE